MGSALEDFIIEEEISVKVKEVVVKPPKQVRRVCHCKFRGCAQLTKEAEESLRKNTNDLIDRNTYLMRLLKVHTIARPRGRKQQNRSRRKQSIVYTLPNTDEINEQLFLKVCKATFMRVFNISEKKLRILINRRSKGELSWKDKRQNNSRDKKFSVEDVISIKRHIEKFPTEHSHYGSLKSQKEFLSPDLNFSRLFKKYKEENPQTKVSRKFYIETFKKFFPNLKFKGLRVDTCHTCDILQMQIQAGNKDSPKSQKLLQEHHASVNIARGEFSKDCKAAVLPQTPFSVATIDLQQVYSIRTLTHSDVFYSKQLSVYNFGIHLEDSNAGFMYVWNESTGSRGANEIASCLFHFLTKRDFVYRKEIRLWVDNCAAQNKNKIMIFMLLWSVYCGSFTEIRLSFLVSGHTYLSSDRDFAVLGNRKKKTMLITPADVRRMIKTTKMTGQPFTVINMDRTDKDLFFNFHELADKYLNTTQLKISDVKSIRIVNDDLNYYIHVKYTFDGVWQKKKVFKRGVLYTQVFNNLKVLPRKRSIAGKLEDIKKLIPYVPARKRKFYENLVENETGIREQNRKKNVENPENNVEHLESNEETQENNVIIEELCVEDW